MNCLILVALLMCCSNNSNCNNGSCGGSRPGGCGREGDGGRNRRDDGCGDGKNGCRRERPDQDDCGCRPDFRPEPRFEQRPFLFNQNADCGCDEPRNNGCGCDCDR